MRRREHSLLWLTLFIAAVVHLELRNIPSPLGGGPLSPLKSASKEPITIEKFEDPNDPRKTIVQTSRARKDEEAEDKKAHFGGEFRNRVKKETQGPNKGRFHEGLAQVSPSTPVEGPKDKEGEEALPKLRDLFAFGSSPNDLSKDVGEGSETLLNTDPVRYASFINRIADEIYDSWVEHARDAARSMYNFGKKLETNTYITTLQIVMDSQGEIRAIQTLRSSGVEELDEAPKKAFWESEPFRNPPSQMFEKESLVRFTYEFHFKFETSSFNIVPWTI